MKGWLWYWKGNSDMIKISLHIIKRWHISLPYPIREFCFDYYTKSHYQTRKGHVAKACFFTLNCRWLQVMMTVEFHRKQRGREKNVLVFFIRVIILSVSFDVNFCLWISKEKMSRYCVQHNSAFAMTFFICLSAIKVI